jgi:long-chain fatty acid transport protein
MRWSHALALGAVSVSVLATSPARATNVTEFPDNGSEQMARGGAWIARASDPLATMFNPAGLAGQPSRITLQNNLIFEHTCFTRLKSSRDTTFVVSGVDQDPLLDGTGHYPRVCNDIQPNINPQLGATLRVNDRLGIGFLIIGPSSGGEKTFPEFVNDGKGNPQAPPNRYLLIQQKGIILFPTLGVGYEVVDDLRVGASVSWGFARANISTAATSLNIDNANATNDVRAKLQTKDYFVPGFTLGALWSATPEIDVAGWYKWSDAIKMRGDVGTAANYYTKQNAQGDDKGVRYGDTIFDDCGTGVPADKGKCNGGDNGTIKFVVPMEAKIGVRYHKPRTRGAPEPPPPPPPSAARERRTAQGPTQAREGTDASVGVGASANAAPSPAPPAPAPRHKRDPMANDVFDVEADLTWANNSAADTVQIRFPGDATGRGLLPVSGVQGGEIPPNGDQYRGYKDVFGVRVGGDYNVVPDRLAVRAGTFYETSAGGEQYQGLDFNPAARFGLALGGTYRIHFGHEDSSSALEVMVGYGHVFYAKREREDRNADGASGLSGTSCVNGGAVAAPEKCADGNTRYRTPWPVNLGTITNSVNVINVGVSYRF